MLTIQPDTTLNQLRDFDLPPIAALAPNLFAATFSVMKMLPARAIIEAALASGELKRGGTVIESTSGTFGLALAMLSCQYDFKLVLISDPVIDPMLRQRFDDLGVQLEIVTHRVAGGYQQARLARLAEIRAANPDYYFTRQYQNPVNAAGYARLADYLHQRIGAIDFLIGTVGTGGSMCGTAHSLREHLPKLEVVGIDTHRSVLFGQPNGERILRGLGNSILPDNLDHTLFDAVHWVSAEEAYLATRELHRSHGLYMGGTSGATYLVARYYAQLYPEARIACLFADDGVRYQHTIYQDAYVRQLPNWRDTLPSSPVMLAHPSEVTDCWSWYPWRRRMAAHWDTPQLKVAS